jgi:hypothetical protein
LLEEKLVVVHDVLATEVGVDVVLLDREAILDALLARPVLAMRLALDVDGLGIHAAVPAEADGERALGFFQTADIQLEVWVVEVDGRDSGIGRVEFGLFLELCASHESPAARSRMTITHEVLAGSARWRA